MCSSNFSSWSCMRYCFDIDGTLCDTPNNEKGKPDYLTTELKRKIAKSFK